MRYVFALMRPAKSMCCWWNNPSPPRCNYCRLTTLFSCSQRVCTNSKTCSRGTFPTQIMFSSRLSSMCARLCKFRAWCNQTWFVLTCAPASVKSLPVWSRYSRMRALRAAPKFRWPSPSPASFTRVTMTKTRAMVSWSTRSIRSTMSQPIPTSTPSSRPFLPWCRRSLSPK